MPAGTQRSDASPTPRSLAIATVMGALCVFGIACAKAPLERDKPCWLEDSCQAPPLSPDANPTQLPFGSLLEGGLHCDEGDCQDWYRVGVAEGGPIQIEVRTLGEGGQGKVSLVLLDERSAPLVQPQQLSQRIERRLPAGRYQLGVIVVGTRGPPLRYSLVAQRSAEATPAHARATGTRASGGAAARGAWAPGRSQPGWVRGDVIEVEAGSAGVLIDAGTTRGLRMGQRGELVQAGRTIARIELIEVYEAGSRARLLAPVTRPIDPLTTEARIHVAPASRAR
ncbi:MAG: hypothetical protein JRH19_07810 [Deltaproteobacteria bacterium]|nr:hypothetical protein [Deltaproteobacteria bacterium]